MATSVGEASVGEARAMIVFGAREARGPAVGGAGGQRRPPVAAAVRPWGLGRGEIKKRREKGGDKWVSHIYVSYTSAKPLSKTTLIENERF
jgi:hypothetical protein